MLFYVGLHHPSDSVHFDRTFISINSVRNRRSWFCANCFILDSGAFTEISKYGEYRKEPEEYAREIDVWRTNNGFQMAVTQDYMCEPFILRKTGKTVLAHQKMTIERYKRIRNATTAAVMPVLQGYKPSEYLEHLEMYHEQGLLNVGMRVGIGSVCKRNSDVQQIEDLLEIVKAACGGMKLHGFGLKTTALSSRKVWESLYSADSMAWSLAARFSGENQNLWWNAKKFEEKILAKHRIFPPAGKVVAST